MNLSTTFEKMGVCGSIYPHPGLAWKRIWGFPKLRDTLLEIPVIRIIVCGGLYWGPPIYAHCLVARYVMTVVFIRPGLEIHITYATHVSEHRGLTWCAPGSWVSSSCLLVMMWAFLRMIPLLFLVGTSFRNHTCHAPFLTESPKNAGGWLSEATVRFNVP